jgi:uncharacterized protein YutE (UPF0331/DUF86 family)
VRKLGLPKESRESFRIHGQDGIIAIELAEGLENMVSFRNILVHQYQDVDIDRMVVVIEEHLEDLVDYTNYIVTDFGAG